jgi:plastocyanin
MHRLRICGTGLVAGAALLFAACGGGTSPKSSAAPTTAANAGTNGKSVTISNFMFSPMSLSVSPGARVRVTNRDSATHTLTATDGQFNTGNITQNQTKTFTAPNKPGKYHYICNIHQFMMGTIIVK